MKPTKKASKSLKLFTKSHLLFVLAVSFIVSACQYGLADWRFYLLLVCGLFTLVLTVSYLHDFNHHLLAKRLYNRYSIILTVTGLIGSAYVCYASQNQSLVHGMVALAVEVGFLVASFILIRRNTLTRVFGL